MTLRIKNSTLPQVYYLPNLSKYVVANEVESLKTTTPTSSPMKLMTFSKNKTSSSLPLPHFPSLHLLNALKKMTKKAKQAKKTPKKTTL